MSSQTNYVATDSNLDNANNGTGTAVTPQGIEAKRDVSGDNNRHGDTTYVDSKEYRDMRTKVNRIGHLQSNIDKLQNDVASLTNSNKSIQDQLSAIFSLLSSNNDTTPETVKQVQDDSHH